MSEWNDIKDSVPSDSREVLIVYKFADGFSSEQMMDIARRVLYKNGKAKWKNDYRIIMIENKKEFFKITHWMDLPEPPK